MAPAELDAVREFYRQVFRTEGWSEVDVRFTPGTWRFLVVSGRREARIRIESRGTLVDIEIGLGEPISAGARGWGAVGDYLGAAAAVGGSNR